MFLLYIDESGSKDKYREKDRNSTSGNSKYFVMGAVLIKAESLSEIEKQISSLKKEYLKDEYSELKSTIKSKFLINGKRVESFKDKLYSTIVESDCFCFGAQLNKQQLQDKGIIESKDDIYKLCFQHILSSINSFFKLNNMNGSVTVFIDRINPAHNKKVYIAYKEALKSKAIDFIGFDEKHFSPSINFVDSEFTIGVQLADLVAGALWRGTERNEKVYSNLLKEKFPVDRNNNRIDFSYSICSEWKK